MKFKVLSFCILLISNSSSATDLLKCEYSKANLSSDTKIQMTPLGQGSVEYDGTHFKAIRPNGSFSISPPLSAGENGLLILDDKTKVFAASVDKTNFAVSDRIAKTTEQWANCSADNEKITALASENEIQQVEKLDGNKAKNYFLNEKHAFTTNCLVWDDVTFITGRAPAMIIAGSVDMGTNPKWNGKEYSFIFNGGSMMARFTPSEPKHKLVIQAGSKFYGCGPSTVDHNYD